MIVVCMVVVSDQLVIMF